MNIQKSSFGKTKDGVAVDLYSLSNSHGLIARITNYGTHITELHMPDRRGDAMDIVLGFDRIEPYLEPNPYFGATIGRVANRIAKGRFTLDGKEYHLPINSGGNTLHGGLAGFDRRVWTAAQAGDCSLRFTYLSPDQEEGFPGNLHATVTISLSETNELRIDYEATTDKPTPVNLTNHSYFNLAGAGRGDVLDHRLTLHADQYTPVDDDLIPTGQIAPVSGTAMDFTTPHAIGERIAQLKGGYDHNFVVNEGGQGKLVSVGIVQEPTSGRTMEVLTTQPGVQFYTGNFLDGQIRGIGGAYSKHGALCLETQHYPDSVNHPNFPTTILRPGETYRQSAVYRFST
jgi:aldose 1-epimerase